MKKENQEYLESYEKYKKIPTYKTIITAVLFFVWAIIDCNIVNEGYYSYSYDDTYGILGLDDPAGVFFLWVFLGAIICVITYVFSKITISPVILQTDALLTLENSLSANIANVISTESNGEATTEESQREMDE